jgi:alkylhydroperoxidase family enzyme
MLRRLARALIARRERALGVALEYTHDLLDRAPGALVALALARPFLQYRRRAADLGAYHVARIAATQAADCGMCVQIAVNVAVRDGVPPEVIRAVLTADDDWVGPELAAVRRFAAAVARANDAAVEEERAVVRARWGALGEADLAVAIAGALAFPALERALGHARGCSAMRVDVGGGGALAHA